MGRTLKNKSSRNARFSDLRYNLKEISWNQWFWNNMDLSDLRGCWPWMAGHFTKGYGCVWLDDKAVRTHRVVWELIYGPIPEGLQVLHSCDNRPCCNPEHLFLGTNQDNVDDRTRKGRGKRPDQVGEKNPSVKLNEENVKEIYNLYKTGYFSQEELGISFGVTSSNIRHILEGRTWKHLTLS